MRGAALIPGAADFVGRLEERGAKFLLLTNNSMYTPRALQLRLEHSGLRVPTDSIYTSAMATARSSSPKTRTARPTRSASRG
jgi:NagD protein